MSLGAPDNEERRLFAEYETATRFYSWAVGELSRQCDVLPDDAYDKLQKLADEAHTDCTKTRVALREFQERRNSK